MIAAALRHIFAIRHAEREDNVDRHWRPAPDTQPDNPPLSKRGREQARDLHNYFDDIEIEAVYVSPFDRAIETAIILVGNRNIPINVEPGICESLWLCRDPPGYRPLAVLVKRFPRLNPYYSPIYAFDLPVEAPCFEGCNERVKTTMNKLAESSKGNIVVVGHDSSVAGIFMALTGRDFYPGQASVAEFVEERAGRFKLQKCSVDHLRPENRTRFTG